MNSYTESYLEPSTWNVTLLQRITYCCQLDFCLTLHHQLGKVIQMNKLDATMIYWSIRSAKHVSGNILPIIRSVRLRFLEHMVSCWCGGQGDGEQQHGCRSPSTYPPQQQDTICCKYLTLLMMGKILPETCLADLIDQ